MKTGVTMKDGPGMVSLKTDLPELTGQKVKIGWFPSAKYPDGTPVAYVAIIQEKGSPINNIPPRPFMAPAEAQNRGTWISLMEQAALAVMEGRQTVGQVLDKLGMRVESDIARIIAALEDPPLADATIAARLRKRADSKFSGNLDKPLIDTGLLFASLSHTIGKAAKG